VYLLLVWKIFYDDAEVLSMGGSFIDENEPSLNRVDIPEDGSGVGEYARSDRVFSAEARRLTQAGWLDIVQ